MKNTIKKKITFFTVILFLFVCFCFLFSERKSSKNFFETLGEDVFIIEKESGFYNTAIEVKIKKNINLPFGTEIFYTLNGNNPTIESEKYTSKILLDITENTVVYPLKVVAYVNGEYSEILEETYILDSNIENRFDLDVISITTDEKNLYDYYTGIFVPGITYDENVANENNIGKFYEGNYNNRGKDWEKDAYITMFDESGNTILHQSVILGVSGNTSVQQDPRSLKIEAKDNQKLNVEFYSPNIYSKTSLNYNYKIIKLRAGQDAYLSNIRSSIASRLSEESNFDGCVSTKRVVVYLNGKFYGIFDMQQSYSNNFIKNKYGLNDNNIIRSKKLEKTEMAEAGLTQYFQNDLNIKENRKLLEEYVDMDNYLLYYAIQVLMNNIDWPHNNYETWKYVGKYDKNNPYSDGRYRFLLYDLDMIYYDYGISSELNSKDILVVLLENELFGNDYSMFSFFKDVMNSNYYRDKFVNIVLDLINTSFDKNNVLKIIDEELEKIKKESTIQMEAKKISRFNRRVSSIKEKVEKREEDIQIMFKKYFNLEEKYSLSIQNTKGIHITWNNMNLLENEFYYNEYYLGTNLSLEALEYPGYDFKYWLVNGEKIYDKYLTINNDFISNNEVSIEIVSEKNALDLIISEISAKSDTDWIKLTNISNKDISLNNYYLSDDKENLKKFKLPNITVSIGSSVFINGSKNYFKIGEIICNFNLSSGETLYLSNNSEIIDILYVPNMNEQETYGRKNNSNYLVYFYNRNNERKEN